MKNLVKLESFFFFADAKKNFEYLSKKIIQDAQLPRMTSPMWVLPLRIN